MTVVRRRASSVGRGRMLRGVATAVAIAAAWTLLVAATSSAQVAPAAARGTELAGAWQGPLVLPTGPSLTLVLHVDTAGGALAARLDSPDQGAFGIPAGEVRFDGARLEITFPSIAGRYEGDLAGADTLRGRWHQGGGTLPLVLVRLEGAPVRRPWPQEPAPPFPYEVEDVSFANPEAGIELSGTLTLPPGPGPFPAVALISGSGPRDRDGAIFNHLPFLVVADHLTRRGIAVLRWDERGVGRSGGEFGTATTREFASDAAAALDFLRRHARIRPDAVGLAGHSEGGLVAGMVAAERPGDVAFLVLLASPGLPGEEVLYMQGEAILRAAGAPPDAVERNLAIQRAIFGVLEEQPDLDAARAEVEAVLRRMLGETPPATRAALGIPEGAEEAWVQGQVAAVTSPWFRFFLTYDPRDDLRRLDPALPVLALYGDRDLQVPAGPNLAALREVLEARGNPFTGTVLRGLNHLFQTAVSGVPAEYGLIEETFAPAALEAVADWIAGVTPAGAR